MSDLENLRREVGELKSRVRELEAAQEDLEKLAERYRIITDLSSEKIHKFVVTPGGKLKLDGSILGKVGDITGYRRDELSEPEQWKKAVHPGDWPELEEALKAVYQGDSSCAEIRLVSKEGVVSWHELVGTPDWDEEQKRLRGVYLRTKDITPQKQAEEEMLRLERLRAIGQMAAGISHNLNNILTAVLGPARVLEQEINDPALRQQTGYIIRSARRARDLVRRLNDAVKGGSEEALRAASVNEAVKEAVELTRSLWKDEPESRGVEIQVVTELGELADARSTSSGLLDIIVNLLLNAVDALPEGGEIVIRTESEGDGVLLTVKDSGVGMDEETRGHIFEPFFTTKSEIGTGLGLSTVYGTVARWGGRVDVTSSVGGGSEFRVWLPRVSAEPEEEVRNHKGPTESRRGKVIVVEDVEAIRSFLFRVLSGEHDVTLCRDGGEAIRRSDGGRYDVAIIDLGISEVPGDRVGRMLRQRDRSLSTILISGWDLGEDDPRVKGFDFRLEKPFDDIVELRRVVGKAVRLRDERAGRER